MTNSSIILDSTEDWCKTESVPFERRAAARREAAGGFFFFEVLGRFGWNLLWKMNDFCIEICKYTPRNGKTFACGTS